MFSTVTLPANQCFGDNLDADILIVIEELNKICKRWNLAVEFILQTIDLNLAELTELQWNSMDIVWEMEEYGWNPREQYYYNRGRCYTSVWKNRNGTGYVVMATNVATGESMAVRNPIECLKDAHAAARRHAIEVARHHRQSERLGF